jgi:hypothetical protein
VLGSVSPSRISGRKFQGLLNQRSDFHGSAVTGGHLLSFLIYHTP